MLLESFLQDLRIGLRILIKEKSFCALAAGVLALGICGVTTQFSLVNAFALRGLAFPDADRLVSGGFVDPSQPNNFGAAGLPFAQDYEDLVASQQSFDATAAFINQSTINVSVDGKAERYTGAYVSESFFRILGVAPILGRDFAASDNTPGAERVTLLSHEIWQRDFSGRQDIVGIHIRLNGRPATIVGVMPPRFSFPVREQLWVPIYSEFPVTPRNDPQSRGSGFLGRLKPGVTLDQASAELGALAKRLSNDHPRTNARFSAALLQPLANNIIGTQTQNIMFMMLGAVVAVLLIACVNVMNMQFARVALRTKELAVRGALGATRWRLARQMLTESLLLASIGAVLGLILAQWAIDAVARASQGLQFPLPYWIEFKLDPTVLTFTLGTTLLAALVSGLVPALLTSRANAADVMKDATRGSSSRLVQRITSSLVVAQIALTAALLIASTLQIKSVINRATLDYGYDTSAVLSARMGLFQADYPSPAARQQFFERLLRELRANPAIEAAALSSRLQMVFDNTGPLRYEVEGTAYVTDTDRPQANGEGVSEGYFETLGLRLLEGRAFTANDLDLTKQPVTIVNASFARKHFGQESPLGRRIRVYNPSAPQPWRTIVGVVTDTLMQGPFNVQVDRAGWFNPINAPQPPIFTTILARPRQGVKVDALAAVFRQELAKVDPNLPLYFVGPPRLWQDAALGRIRIIGSLFAVFGVVAVVLSAVGLYGVMSFSVNQRTQEFGIRMALGADGLRILRMVLKQGARQLAIGLLAGAASALVLFQLASATVQNFLFQVSTTDPSIYGGVCLLLAVVALAACLVPALRATRVDPMVALRAE